MKTEKKKTIEVLDIMIQHADKGPSGFWVDDYEGCGNPKIFPEFEEGLKRGRLVQKEHYLCPWNTAVMYGNGRGNIHTGCYHSCSIEKAKYLSADMLKSILKRFKDSMSSGKYDDKDKITPLLTTSEIEYIEEQEKKEKRLEEERYKAERAERIKRAAKLIQKYPEHKELFASYYGEKVLAQTYDGNIDFNPNGYADVVGAEKFTYDDYIDVQIRSFHKTRGWFATCFYNIPLSFKGTIERKTKDNICFERIFVEGMYPDGLCFDGKEEHVWMSLKGFEEYEIGDSVSFFADVYRYVKTSNGKQIDYSLREPQKIEKIENYKLPTDKELAEQAVNDIICETCYLGEQCNRISCLRPKKRTWSIKKRNDKNGDGREKEMKKIAISLVLLLLLNLCGCSILPVGTNISSIETLKSWSFQYNEGTNDYSVFFALLTDTERYVSADVDADIRIVNENGEEVYKGTHSVSKNDFGYYSSQAAGKQYLANLKIPASDIMAGTSANGKVYITIYKDESLRFDEVNCEALYCLPIKDVQISASSLPKEVVIKGYDGKIESKIKVESVTYIYEKEFTSQLKITVSGTKTYGSSSSYDMIKYKIYDSKKFVVEDGIFYLSSLSSGDKFKDDSIVIYDVVPGETYSIDFFEYN